MSGGNRCCSILLLLPLVGAAGAWLRWRQPARREAHRHRRSRSLELVLHGRRRGSPTRRRRRVAAPGSSSSSSVPWIPAFGTSLRARRRRHRAGDARADRGARADRACGFSWDEKLPEGRSVAGSVALLLATQGLLVGVFAATDVFLFYVFFEAMLVPMYFMIGRFGGPRRQYAAVKFFLYSLLGGLIMLAVGDRAVRRERPAARQGHVHLDELQQLAADAAGVHADLAVPRLLRRLRDQGAAGAVPHLAARRRCRGPDRRRACCSSACSTRSARSASCATACRCSRWPRQRLAPLVLILAVIGILYARAARRRADRHEAVRGLHLDRALRLHRAGHLRLLHARRSPARRSTWSTTASRPACCSSSSAC